MQQENRGTASRKSGGFAVVLQHAAQTITSGDLTLALAYPGTGLDQPVLEPLVISLRMIVGQELTHGVLQRSLPEEDHPLQAFL